MAFSGQTFSDGNVLLASELNQMDTNTDEVRKAHYGTATPAELTAGVQWIDTNLTPPKFKVYDGAAFISAFTIDETNNIIFPRIAGAMVRKTGVQSIPNNTTTLVTWDDEDVDDMGIFNVASNSILLVPGGVSRVQLFGSARFAVNGTGIRQVTAQINGGFPAGTIDFRAGASSTQQGNVQGMSGILDVSSGDRVEMYVFQDSGGSLNMVNGAGTWFTMVCYA